MTATATETADPVHLSLFYCDSCSVARALYRVWVDRWRVEEDGSAKSLDVVLCSHHFNEHEAYVLEQGYDVDDV